MRLNRHLFRCTIVLVVTMTAASTPTASAYRRPGASERVSLGSDGSDPGTDSGTWLSSHVSRNGRYVVFETEESLVPADRRGLGPRVGGHPNQDIYVRDRKLKTTKIVSVASNGTRPPLAASWTPAMTPDGRYVAFATSNPLVPGDTNLASDIFVRDLKLGKTERVSVDSNGKQTMVPFDDHGSSEPSISDDGRYVAFMTAASDLVDDDTNGAQDVFVHDRRTRKTIRVSVATDGREADFTSEWGNISGNGRFVLFQNGDKSLAPDYGDAPDYTLGGQLAGLWMRDLKRKRTEFVIPGGVPDGEGRVLSADGRFITFNSFWKHYVPNDANPMPLWGIDTFVFDRKTQRVERVSVTSSGEEAENSSTDPKISGNGRYVSFESQADNLFQGNDTSPEQWPQTDVDAFVHDRLTGATEMVSVAPDGSQTPACAGIRSVSQAAFDPAVSWDGNYVSFVSCSNGLDGRDSDQATDVFVRDIGPDLGVRELVAAGRAVSLSLEGRPGLSRTGTVWIKDVVPDAITSRLEAAGELLGARITYRPLLDDLYVVLEIDHMPRTPLLAAVTAGSIFGMTLKIDRKTYEIRVAPTGLGARGETTAAFGLFSCADRTGVCTKISDLTGGFGTTGERVTISVPLRSIGVEHRAVISDPTAFTALGSYLGGRIEAIDEVTL